MRAAYSGLCRYFGCPKRAHVDCALCLEHELAYIADRGISTSALSAYSGQHIVYASAEDCVYWWAVDRIRAGNNGRPTLAMVCLGVPE